MHRQLHFRGINKVKDVFGGSLLKSHPKGKRPLHSKFPIHLVVKANESAMRKFHTLKPVNDAVIRICKKHGVSIYEYANVGNHLHLAIRLRSIHDWSGFIKELTGRIAQIAGKKGVKFWKHRPFTRVVRSWRRGFKTLKEYLQLNRLEAAGLINRTAVKTLKDLRARWAEDQFLLSA